MGKNDHIFDVSIENELRNCPNCNKTYICVEEEQTPGFRDLEEERCPYCGSVNNRNMTYDYYCRRLSDDDKKYLNEKNIPYKE